MTPEQTLEKFIDSFDSKISAHLLEVQDIESAKIKAQLIFLYQNKQSGISSNTMLLHDKAKPQMVLEHELAPRNDYDDNQDRQDTSHGNKNNVDKNPRSTNRGQVRHQNNYTNRGQNWRSNTGTSQHGRSFGRNTRGRYRGRNNYYSNNDHQQQGQDQSQYRPQGRQGSQQWCNRSSYGYTYK